ncbi:hypothetical protein [Paramagnetospirillum marisnigri]|nr:hypothetical protein [Paramagnetospirillum marisnigri]
MSESDVKAVLLASLVSLCLFAAMTTAFRFRPHLPKALLSLRVFYGSLPVLLVTYWATPADLGFLPSEMAGGPVWLDLLLAVFFLSASYFGGWLQLYNIGSRGYSLRIAMDAALSPRRSLTPEEVLTGYSDGHGLTWMYDTRMDGLRQGGFVTDQGEMTVLEERGRKTAGLFRMLRSIYVLGKASP